MNFMKMGLEKKAPENLFDTIHFCCSNTPVASTTKQTSVDFVSKTMFELKIGELRQNEDKKYLTRSFETGLNRKNWNTANTKKN